MSIFDNNILTGSDNIYTSCAYKKIYMSSPDFIIIPRTIGESPTSSGYLEVTGRHVEPEGFNVYLTSLIDDTRGRMHILTDEG